MINRDIGNDINNKDTVAEQTPSVTCQAIKEEGRPGITALRVNIM